MASGGARSATERRLRWSAPLVLGCALVGCRSDLNQQLLERELRYQEDQIYLLQDELQTARSRLERTTGENTSLRRQLGVDGPAAGPRTTPARGPATLPAPVAVPPAIEIPERGAAPTAPGGGRTAPPAAVGPPMLEGVPPLPREGADLQPPAAVPFLDEPPLALPPPAAAGAPKPGAVRTMSFEEPAAEDGRPRRLVVNPDQTVCVDANGDGRSDGLTLVFEPRDAAERLVAAGGDVRVVVFDTAAGADAATGEAAPIAAWDIAAADVAGRFRRTSRQRGVLLELPWPAARPAGGHVRVVVTLVRPDGPPLEADATIPAR
jgi:hypothetical protein